MTKASRVKTGIDGLDNVLAGGLPSGHLYLIEGDPGTGKTTLALQFLLSGVEAGEPTLYVTLSESKSELHAVAKSHGWTLDSINIFELLPEESSLRPDGQYTVFHPSEVELADTTKAMLDEVEKRGPRRIVIDSLSELRMLAGDPLRYRRQILALKEYFAGRQCTVLLLDDRTSTDHDLQLQSIAHGVLAMENLPREFGIKRRRVEVVKLRASTFREGYHDYGIKTGGLEVYPRLIAAEHRPGFRPETLPSGLKELDDLWGGGIDRGTSTLIMGPAGAGKSSDLAQYAVAATERGEAASVYLFDEGLQTFLTRARGLGMNADSALKKGLLQLEQIDPAELSPGEFVTRIRKAVEVQHARLIIIDSLNGFLNAMPGEQRLILQLHELITFLNQQGVATFLIMAQHGLLGREMASPVDVSYLADSVLLLRFFESQGEVKQALSIVKKRTGRHERSIRELQFNGRICIGHALAQFRGILSGIPDLITGKSSENR